MNNEDIKVLEEFKDYIVYHNNIILSYETTINLSKAIENLIKRNKEQKEHIENINKRNSNQRIQNDLLQKKIKELEELARGFEKIRDLKVPADTDFIIVMKENYLPYILTDYIPKSKVREKIEQIKMNANYDWIYKYDYQDVTKILQELLEERN